jgi:hypothetical protein
MVDPNEPVPPVIVTTEPEILFFDKKYLYLCSGSSLMLALIVGFVLGQKTGFLPSLTPLFLYLYAGYGWGVAGKFNTRNHARLL